MAGMRAGASDELTVPFDMEALRRKMAEAFRRSRARKARKHRHPLVTAFEDAMSAAAFAESGEFETAREMLSSSDPAGNSGSAECEKQEESSLNSNASKR
jgi:DNA-binding response OmpR family regulator